MSVVAGVRYRNLISQLTEQEKKSFTSSLNPNLIAKALFYYVIHQSKTTASGGNQTDDVTQMVSDIIQSRKPVKKEKKDIKLLKDTKCKSLDQLPQRLIGKVASYLQEGSYRELSHTNRAIYIGCNTPNLLQSLHVDSDNQAIKDKITKMPRYPFAKHVQVDVEKLSTERADSIQRTFCQMQRARSVSIWMQATCRSQCAFETIAGRMSYFWGPEFAERIEFLDVFINEADQPVTNCFHPYWFSPSRFAYALICFLNVKYLSLTMRENRIDEEEYDQKDLDLVEFTFNDLLGLRLDGMDEIGETVLRTNHKSLRYLSIGLWRGYSDGVLLNSLTFPAVKELQFNGDDLLPITVFVQSASSTNLERMSLDIHCGLANESTAAPEAMESIIEEVIAKYLKLNVLRIVVQFEDPEDAYYDDANWANGHEPMTASIFNGIEEGLMETQDLLRDTFKIWIKTTLINQEERVQFMQNLSGMMRALINCNIQDFMVILRINGTVDADEKKTRKLVGVIPAIKQEELESLKSLSDSIMVHKVSPTPWQKWVISNKGCKMNGYSEQWMMSRRDRWITD